MISYTPRGRQGLPCAGPADSLTRYFCTHIGLTQKKLAPLKPLTGISACSGSAMNVKR